MVALVKIALITKLNLILFDYFDFPERSWNVFTDCNGYFGCAIAEIAINSFSTLMSKFIALLYITVIVDSKIIMAIGHDSCNDCNVHNSYDGHNGCSIYV